MARSVRKRPADRPPREQRQRSSSSQRQASAERPRGAPNPAHILNQFPLYMSNPGTEAKIHNALMPPSVPMTKTGQRDSLVQILWSNLLETKIPIPASVLTAMCPSRQDQDDAIRNALSDALHQRLLTFLPQRAGGGRPGGGGAGGGRPGGGAASGGETDGNRNREESSGSYRGAIWGNRNS